MRRRAFLAGALAALAAPGALLRRLTSTPAPPPGPAIIATGLAGDRLQVEWVRNIALVNPRAFERVSPPSLYSMGDLWVTNDPDLRVWHLEQPAEREEPC